MATNTVWSPRSPNITNGQIKIANPPAGTSRNNIQTDWKRLNPNSANPAVKNLEYRVNNLNVVEFRYPTTNDPNGPKSTANSIQEIADDSLYVAAYGYTPTTTQLIQDSLRKELTSQAESIGWASRVAAQTPPQGDQQGGNTPPSKGNGTSTPADRTASETPTPPDLPEPSQPINENLSLPEPIDIVPRGTAGIQYPRDMKPEQDKIRFTAVKIEKSGFGGSGLQFTFGDIKYTPVAGPIQLAIQAPISDQNSVEWGPDSVNAIDAAIFNASLDLMTTPWENIPTELQSKATGIYNTAKSNSERIRRFLAGQAASLNNVLSRTDGAILNPNLELLFQGPQLRPFTFQFKMTARYRQEAEDIKKIIKYFKYFMAVRKEQNNLFLRAPYVFTIEYMHKNQNLHPGINIISPDNQTKACALTNCSVDYTPLGTYMTYEEGTMVAYTLSLQFQEITPIYDTDYKDYENHPIGF